MSLPNITRVAALIGVMAIIATRAEAQIMVYTWTGGSTTSSNWNDTGNWMGGTPPVSSTMTGLDFSATARTTNTDNIASPPLALNSINFGTFSIAYTLNGNALDFQTSPMMTAPTITAAGGPNTINNPVNLSSTLTTSGNGTFSSIIFAGGLTGTGGLTVSNKLTTIAAAGGTATYSGATTVSSNSQFEVDGILGTSTSLITITSATFGGSGTVNRSVETTGVNLYSTGTNTFTINGDIGNLTGGGTTAATTINIQANSNIVINGNTNITGLGSSLNAAAHVSIGGTGTIHIGDGTANVSRPSFQLPGGGSVGPNQTITLTGFGNSSGGYASQLRLGDTTTSPATVYGPVNVFGGEIDGPSASSGGVAGVLNGPVQITGVPPTMNSYTAYFTGQLNFNNSVTVDPGARVDNESAMVLNGTLNNNGTFANNFGGTLSVGLGGTLSGNGVVGGATVILPLGNVSPGHSPGSLTFTGSLTLNGKYVWELNANSTAGPGTNYDQIIADGPTTVGATSSLSVSLLSGVNLSDPFWSVPETWIVLDASGGTLSGGFGSVTNGTYPTGFFSTVLQGNTELLEWTPVPEPSTLALTGLAAIGFIARRRRMRNLKV